LNLQKYGFRLPSRAIDWETENYSPRDENIIIDAQWREIKNRRSFQLGELFKIIRPGHKVIRILPDTSVRNWHTEDIAKTISDSFRIPLDRFYFENGWKLRYRVQDRITWEIEFSEGKVEFLICVPEDRVDVWTRRLSAIWEKATVTVDEEYRDTWDFNDVTMYELVYRKHDMYSLDINAKNNLPLPSILQTSKTVGPGDKAKLFVYYDPISRMEWNSTFREAWEKLRKGRQPTKRHSDFKAKFKFGATVLGHLMQEIMLGIADLLKTDDKENIYKQKDIDPEAGQLAIKHLSPASKRKGELGALKTYIWAIAQSEDKGRRETTARTLSGAFADLAADNELEAKEIKNKKKKAAALNTITTKQGPRIKFNCSILSTAEAGKIIQVPGRELQEDYPQVNGIKIQEVVLPEDLFQKYGIPLGQVTERGVTRLAVLPINDADIECKGEINYGSMGAGKTGRGIVLAVSGVSNGRTVIFFDMADGDAIDQTRDALPQDMPDYKILDLDFGNKHYPIPLTLTDIALQGNSGEDELDVLDAAEKMTDYIHTFINQLASTEFSDRMEYFLTPVGKGVLSDPGRGLLDVILGLSSPVYRERLLNDPVIQSQPEVVTVLNELQRKAVNGTDKTLVQPILDRLNLLAGKRTLANIFLQPEKLDENGLPLLNFRKLMDNEPVGDPGADKYGYFVGIRIPKAVLGKDGVNRIASFLMAKIWLATLSRLDIPQNERKPFYTIIDEPHNCLEGTGNLLDGEIGVEARKYRNKMVFLAHSAEQFGRYRAGIYAGGPFFNFFKTEYQKTFLDHAEKLQPLDAKSLYEQLPKRWVAACKMELPNVDSLPAFICKMQAPPKRVKDRSYRREACSKQFGRYWKDVVQIIHEKRSIVIEDEAWRETKQAETAAKKTRKKAPK